MASLYYWLHDTGNYSFNGETAIAGLLPAEINALLLGQAVENERRENGGEPLSNGDKQRRKLERNRQQHRQRLLQRGWD